MSNYHFETLQLHVGQEQADPASDARAVPIYATTSYVFHNSQHAADRFSLADSGNIYGRLTNSTQDVFEKRIAALEGGTAGLAVASGAAAIVYAIQALARQGEHIVAQKTIYGGTSNLLAHTLPQYGINRAGVVYEVPVEGEMNRYMALIEDYDGLERIGSVRSARTCYTYFAREYDAIFAHYGQSTFAKKYLNNVDNINGLDGIGGTAYYRTKDRKAPHNAYTSGERVNKAIEKLGYRTGYGDSYEGHFQFARGKEQIVPDSDDAFKVVPGYPMNKPWFEYQESDGLYHRFQYGSHHKGNEGLIAVKNIIFQYVEWGHYASTPYLNINVHKGREGYYFTNGKYQKITWKKDGEFGVTRYYDLDGNEITLNKGKTWICIIGADRYDKAEIYGK